MKKIKKIFLRILVFVVIIVLIFCPYLLIVDYKRYSSFVFLIWFLSIVYYLLIKKRIDQRIKSEDNEKEELKK